MSKAHRGRPLKEETPQSGRGTCPVTGRSGVKLLYEQEIDGKKVMVSKAGKAALVNMKRRQARDSKRSQKAAESVAASPKPVAASPKPVAEPVAEEPAVAEAPAAETETPDETSAENDASPEPEAESPSSEEKGTQTNDAPAAESGDPAEAPAKE